MCDDSTQLWDFVLSRYARPEVATACLALQDQGGADVCELLWVVWLATQGLSLADDAERALAGVRRWQRRFTYPLRAQRRALKAQARSSRDIARLRQTLKEAELLAEREALHQLQVLTTQRLGVCPMTAPSELKKNLAWLLPKQKKTLLWALQTLETCLDPQ